MRVSENIHKAINKQINAEMWSANLYLSMAMHFTHEGYDGFANWLTKQSAEETEHAMEMAEYLNSRGARVEICAIDAVPTSFDSAESVFEQVLKHECEVSEMIDKIVHLADAEKDLATRDFFMGFVKEQVEEEDSASKALDLVRKVGEKNLFFADAHFARRKE